MEAYRSGAWVPMLFLNKLNFPDECCYWFQQLYCLYRSSIELAKPRWLPIIPHSYPTTYNLAGAVLSRWILFVSAEVLLVGHCRLRPMGHSSSKHVYQWNGPAIENWFCETSIRGTHKWKIRFFEITKHAVYNIINIPLQCYRLSTILSAIVQSSSFSLNKIKWTFLWTLLKNKSNKESGINCWDEGNRYKVMRVERVFLEYDPRIQLIIVPF